MNETKSKATPKQIDRIILHSDTADRLTRWMEELSTKYKGLRITRTDLANHLLMSRAATLSVEEAESIRSQFFDEVSFAAWVLKEARAAKARGETISIAELYDGLTQPSKPRRTRKAATAKRFEESVVPESEPQDGEEESEVV